MYEYVLAPFVLALILPMFCSLLSHDGSPLPMVLPDSVVFSTASSSVVVTSSAVVAGSVVLSIATGKLASVFVLFCLEYVSHVGAIAVKFNYYRTVC